MSDARPFSVPPGTSKDRLLTLRKLFKGTLEDPEFLADAKKSKLLITYVSSLDFHGTGNQLTLGFGLLGRTQGVGSDPHVALGISSTEFT
jgi:hypothetical protein